MIETDFLGPLVTTIAVALTVSWTCAAARIGGDCAAAGGGGDGDCGTVTGATTVISGRGDGSLVGDNGATTGGRSFLVVTEVSEEDSSVIPKVGLIILAK
jgi:hypothetical protein